MRKFTCQTVKFLTLRGPPAEVIHMTIDQRKMIDSFRSQGMGYKRIAAQLGISENTVKSYLRRNTQPEETVSAQVPVQTPQPVTNTHICWKCGKPVTQNPGRKEKKFCSDACRFAWWNAHQDLVKRKAVYHFTCPTCGREFTAYGKANRKYCSHDCYIRARFGGAVCE